MREVRSNAASLRGHGLRRTPDAALVDSAVRGDPAAFAEVYRRFHTPVYAFCLSRLLQPSAAEDACQEVFVRLLSADPSSIRRPLSWLFGVARHVCIDIARRQSREVATELSDHPAVDPFDTLRHVTAREDAERIAISLRGLNPRYRTALVMHEMHAQTAPEIARAFGLGLGATYTLLSRAREAFETAYARAEGLSEPCKMAISILYRRSSLDASEAEELRLEQHLAECESCRREAHRFARSERLASLRSAISLPILPGWWLRSQPHVGRLAYRIIPDAIHGPVASAAAAVSALALVAAVTTATVPSMEVRFSAPAPASGQAAALNHGGVTQGDAGPDDEQLIRRRHEHQRLANQPGESRPRRPDDARSSGGESKEARPSRTGSGVERGAATPKELGAQAQQPTEKTGTASSGQRSSQAGELPASTSGAAAPSPAGQGLQAGSRSSE